MAELRHLVWIDAPVMTVYGALASADGLSEWWAPHTAEETREGLVLAHSPGEAHGDVRMRVAEDVPGKRIVWEIISTHPKQSPASAWTGTRITFGIEERSSPGAWMGQKTEGEPLTALVFAHEGWNEASEFLPFCNYAWGVTLDLLRQWCESQDVSSTA